MIPMKNILIIYPGFLHYRKGIIDELLNSDENNYIFVGDKNGFNSIKPFDFDKNSRFHHFKTYRKNKFLFSKGLLKFIWKQKVDGAIVHASPYWITLSIASIILKLKGVKVYNWGHGILENQKSFKNIFYYYYNKIFFDGLLLYGNIAKSNLINMGYEPKKLKVIYNSLDYNNQIKYRNELTSFDVFEFRRKIFSQPSNKQLIFIGRLTQWKKLDQLLEVVAILKQQKNNINLLIVGDGNQKEHLKNMIELLDVKELVHFYGPSYDEKTNSMLIGSSDCCVAPGDIGLTAIHSLMYGTPVISHSDPNSQMPEFEAIKIGENGLLFQKDNIEDLKEKIISILKYNATYSEDERRKKCYQIVDTYYNPKYQIGVINKLF